MWFVARGLASECHMASVGHWTGRHQGHGSHVPPHQSGIAWYRAELHWLPRTVTWCVRGACNYHERRCRGARIIDPSDTQWPLRRGPSSTAIPSVRRLLRNQLHEGFCAAYENTASRIEVADQGTGGPVLPLLSGAVTGGHSDGAKMRALASLSSGSPGILRCVTVMGHPRH